MTYNLKCVAITFFKCREEHKVLFSYRTTAWVTGASFHLGTASQETLVQPSSSAVLSVVLKLNLLIKK